MTGWSQQPDPVKPGDEVTLVCDDDTRPMEWTITWTHSNGSQTQQSGALGVGETSTTVTVPSTATSGTLTSSLPDFVIDVQ